MYKIVILVFVVLYVGMSNDDYNVTCLNHVCQSENGK
jgi:hypothetical protein